MEQAACCISTMRNPKSCQNLTRTKRRSCAKAGKASGCALSIPRGKTRPLIRLYITTLSITNG